MPLNASCRAASWSSSRKRDQPEGNATALETVFSSESDLVCSDSNLIGSLHDLAPHLSSKMTETLIDKTNALLTGYSQHKLYAVELKNELLERASREHEQQQQSQLARSTTENLTSYTNLSDGSGFSVDPNDLKRLDGDMERYKNHFSQVKLQWLETLLKRKTLQRLLGTLSEDEQDGIEGIITLEHVQMLEEARSKQKQELKQSKAEAEQLSFIIVEIAKELDVCK